MLKVVANPFGATRPMLLLPDWRPCLELVDDITSCHKRLVPVTRSHRNGNAGLTNLQRPNPVDHRNSFEVPPVASLGDNFRDLCLNHLVIRFVLEVRHPVDTFRMIPNGAKKQIDGAALWCCDRFDEAGRVYQIGAHNDRISVASPLFVRSHTIISVDNNNADPWEIFRPPADAGAEPNPTEPNPTEPNPTEPDDIPLAATTTTTASPAALSPPPVMEQVTTPPTPPLFPYVAPHAEPVAGEPADRHPGRKWLQPLLGGLVGAAMLAGVFWATGVFDDPPEVVAVPDAAPGVIEIREVVTPGDGLTSAAAVARKVVPSIVTVDVGADLGGSFDRFASGSGVVLTSDGLIVTNQHVIADAERIQVIFEDGRLYEAEVVGSDARTDLAVLRIATAGLIPIEIGSTETAQIGETAIAVGSPLGLDGGPSLTVGVVSAFGRQVRTGPGDGDILFDMLQTDAPITQGSSGGALVDGEGRLLGITSAIGVSSAGAEGIGFAIPIELVTRITDEIIETGTVEHAFLGISLDLAFTEATDGAQVPAGALVISFAVDPSAAQAAGVEVGDRIIGYNGNLVAIQDDLISGLRRLRVGDTVILELVRGTEQLEIAVVLGVRPDDI